MRSLERAALLGAGAVLFWGVPATHAWHQCGAEGWPPASTSRYVVDSVGVFVCLLVCPPSMPHGGGTVKAPQEIPEWRSRMPGDPEIDRDVKTIEEKLWESCYDQDYSRVEFLLGQAVKQAADREERGLPPFDIDWKCTARKGVFMPPEPQHSSWSAFHVACAYGKLSDGKCVKMLVDAGCDVDAVTKRGRTGWDLARLNKQRKVVDYLDQCASDGTIAVNGPQAGRRYDTTLGETSCGATFELFDYTFEGTFDVSPTGKLYDQKRAVCTTVEFRAPLADKSFWGSYTPSPLQDVEANLLAVQKKLKLVLECGKKVGEGMQLTPMEQERVKPRDPEALKQWPGHDYHGKFVSQRISELDTEVEKLERIIAALKEGVFE